MTVILQSLNRRATKFQERIEYATDTMKMLGLSDDIQDEVKHYLSYTQVKQDYQEDYDKFIALLSPSLKQKVVSNLFYLSLLKNPIFKDQEELLQSMLIHLKTRTFVPEDKIIRQGEIGTSIYFLAQGQCEVFVSDENKI